MAQMDTIIDAYFCPNMVHYSITHLFYMTILNNKHQSIILYPFKFSLAFSL